MSSDAQQAAALFDPQRLRLARQLQGLQRTQLAEQIGVSAAAISQFELGKAKPRPATVAQLALTLQLPVMFFSGTGRSLPSLEAEQTFFRSLRRTTKRDRERALAHAALLAELVRLIETRVVLPSLDLPDHLALSSEAPIEEAERLAEELRWQWEIPPGPLRSIVRTLERRGIVVARFPLMTHDVDAFSWPLPDRPLVVLSTEKRNYERSRLDAAHELGHLLMHHADPEPGSHPMERQAQRFGSAFIAPAADIREELPTGRVDWPRLLQTKAKWGLSLGALLYRAKELGTLSSTAYESALKYMSRRGWRTREPGPVRSPEEPMLLQKAITTLRQDGTDIDSLLAGQHLLDGARLEEMLQLRTQPEARVVV